MKQNKKTYIKTNKNLTINEIKVLKNILDEYFGCDFNIGLEDDEIIFTEN